MVILHLTMAGKLLMAIPARIGSTRLPRKPLVKLKGIPLVVRVAKNCLAVKGADVVVLTDSNEVKHAVEEYGIQCEIVKGDFRSGTERVAHFAAASPEYSVIFNVQGDEPLIKASVLERGVEEFKKYSNIEYLTFATPLNDVAFYHDPNTVKVVTDKNGFALYFSRAPVPCVFKKETASINTLALKHIGIYGFRRGALLEYVKMAPCVLEEIENLEQLRLLEHGRKIKVVTVEGVFHSVDTPEDVKVVEALLEREETDEG